MTGTHDEQAILREAARRSADESIERFRKGKEALEETLNDCLYHAGRRARERRLDDDEARVFERVREAIYSRDPARLEAATNMLAEHYAQEIGGHFDPRVYKLAERVLPKALSVLLSA